MVAIRRPGMPGHYGARVFRSTLRHHRFLESLAARPVEAHFVPVGVIEIGMSPTPGHKLRRLSERHAGGLEGFAKSVEISGFEIEANSGRIEGFARLSAMQGDGSAGSAQARVTAAEFFD